MNDSKNNSLASLKADRMSHHIPDERDMDRFLPPHAPLSMPVQDLTPRFGFRKALAVLKLSQVGRQ